MNTNELLERIAADLAALAAIKGEERTVSDWVKRLEVFQIALSADLDKAARWAEVK